MYGPAEVTFTLEQLRHQWSTPAMTSFLVVLGGLLCLLQWLYMRITEGGLQVQPQLAASMEGGGSGSGDKDPDSQHLMPAGSGKWVNSGGGSGSGGGTGLGGLQREQDAVTVFAGALLFSAVASFVGAWSVLFSKSMTYVVSYMPASLTDW
jgi:hypothetical protein